jgi:DNA-binding NarL/FixJ family response regulator
MSLSLTRVRSRQNHSQDGCRVNENERQIASAQQKSVLLADDNPVILETVRRLLTPEFLVLAAVPDGNSVLREVESLEPDIVVLDISIGDPDGIVVARQLQTVSSHTKIVFLSCHEIAEFVRVALASGGAAYVFKSRLSSDLIPAIHAACSGQLFVSCGPQISK